MVFTVAGASEYLAITGYGIPDINIVKKAVVIPGQRCIKFDISPVNYSFEMQSMSKEKLLFSLPVVFTIGLRTDNIESLTKYAKLLAPHDKLSQHVKELVLGIIEGETRVLAASMTMEEIFQGTRAFKQEVFEKIQLELDQFGLVIYNANVKQLVDVQGNEYFSYLGKKTQYEAANQAKVDIAEAKMKGEVGAKIRDGEIKQNAAKVEAETKIYSAQREGDGLKSEVKVKAEVKIFETKREAEVAEASAELLLKKASWTRQAKIAEVEAAKAVAMKDAELQIEVERKNVLRQIEKFKADLLSKAIVEYDIKVQEANSELYKKQKAADAMLYERQKIAEGSKASAEAARFARQQQADADLYATKKKAEGLVALGQAQNDYLSKVMDSVNGSYFALRDYLMINNGIYQDMAKISAEAIHGMQPKISIWNNGPKASDGGYTEDMNGVFRMLPPFIQTVQEETGMSPPAWMGTLTERSRN